jgi:hypothetical protein
MKNQSNNSSQVPAEPVASSEMAIGSVEPLLYQKRENASLPENAASTTSCQTTINPTDYGPDD